MHRATAEFSPSWPTTFQRASMFSSPIPGRVAPKGREPNLPGDRYGRLTLVEEVLGQGYHRRWLCKCDCGADKILLLTNLRAGYTGSCGCLHKEATTGTSLVAPGHLFGRLTVVSQAPNRLRGICWNVLCSCGTEKEVCQSDLRGGNTLSCGCLRAEITSKRNTTHGMARTLTHITWQALIQRCTNPENPAWDRYGGRGITVCDRWRNSFEAFLSDMGERPKGLSLDRVDNSKGYEPENCAWATAKEQARNTRRNRLVSFQGHNICLAEAAEIADLPYWKVRHRLNAKGWTPSQALESHEFGEPLLELPN